MSFFDIFRSPELKQIQDETLSYPASVAQKIYQDYSFSRYLPYMAYDEESHIYHNNDDSYGMIIEITPRISMGQGTADFGREIFELIPAGITLQMSLIGSKNIVPIIERYKDFHRARDNEILSKAIESCAEFFYYHTQEPLTFSIKSRIKNHRCFISLRCRDAEDLSIAGDEIFRLLKTNSFHPQWLKPASLKVILYEIFNGKRDLGDIPPYEPERSLNKQLIEKDNKIDVNDDSFVADSRHWICLLPSSLGERASISKFGEKLGDTISQGQMNMNQFTDTFILTTTFSKLTDSELTVIKARQGTIQKQRFPEVFTIFHKKKKESYSIMESLDAKIPAFMFDMVVAVSGDTLNQAKDHAETIKSFWSKGHYGVKLNQCKFIPHIAFLGALPFGASEDYFRCMGTSYDGFKQFSNELSHFMPLEADSVGNYPNSLFVSRRGQISGWDNFKTKGNKNGMVIATSGAGKSFFLNYMAMNHYASGAKVYIIDIGGSYRSLCEVVGGEWIEVIPDSPMSFNPFSTIYTEDELDLPFLSTFFYTLGANKNREDAQREQGFMIPKLQEAIKSIYRSFGPERTDITKIRDYLNSQYDDPRIKDFCVHITPFCLGGPYGKFMNGPSVINMKKPFVVLELGAVEEETEIRDAVLFMMIYHMSREIYLGTTDERTQVIIDEAHKFLGKSARMDEFMEQAYRRFRKHNGSIILATQSFQDIYSSTEGISRAGQVIMNNSAFKFFLKQDELSVNALMESGIFKLDDYQERLMKSIHRNDNGEYSEFLLITPDNEYIPYRTVISRYLYWVYTTDGDDKAKLRSIRESLGLSLLEAIDYIVAEEKHHGRF